MIVDTALTEDEEIVFNAGSHWQTVEMRYADYARLVKPRVASFADHLTYRAIFPLHYLALDSSCPLHVLNNGKSKCPIS